MSHTPPSLAVVVLNWCGEGDTAACLRSLQAEGTPGVEILLVDNASPDGSGPRLHEAFPEIPYLQTDENRGYTGGNNIGIRWALERRVPWVLILNNDTVVEPGALGHLLETAASGPKIGAVVPQIVYHDRPDRVWYGGGHFSATRGIGLHAGEGGPSLNGTHGRSDVTFLTGCAVLLSAEAIRDVGAFADDFFAYMEDAELSVRLALEDWRIVFEPRATVLHRVPPLSDDPEPFQIRLRDRNRRRLMRRHFSPLQRVPFTAWFYASRLAHLGRYLLRRDGERARAIVQGMLER